MIRGPSFTEERPVIVMSKDVEQKCLEIKADGNTVVSVEEVDERMTKIVYRILMPDFQ